MVYVFVRRFGVVLEFVIFKLSIIEVLEYFELRLHHGSRHRDTENPVREVHRLGCPHSGVSLCLISPDRYGFSDEDIFPFKCILEKGCSPCSSSSHCHSGESKPCREWQLIEISRGATGGDGSIALLSLWRDDGRLDFHFCWGLNEVRVALNARRCLRPESLVLLLIFYFLSDEGYILGRRDHCHRSIRAHILERPVLDK